MLKYFSEINKKCKKLQINIHMVLYVVGFVTLLSFMMFLTIKFFTKIRMNLIMFFQNYDKY